MSDMPSLKTSTGKFSGFHQCNSRTTLFVRGNKSYHNGSRRRRTKSALSLLSSAEKGSSLLKVFIPSRSPLEELHRLFPFLPPDEFPTNVFTCALSKDILLQGKMFVSQNWICFYSNIFGYETKVKIELKNVMNISREKTVFFVPNAISITTANKRYLFCSFLSRETVYKLLLRVWHVAIPDSKMDEKDGTSLDLLEEEIIIKDIPVGDFSHDHINVFGTPSMSFCPSLRRSLSFCDFESSSLKDGYSSACVQRGSRVRRISQEGRTSYPFIYSLAYKGIRNDEHQSVRLKRWRSLCDTRLEYDHEFVNQMAMTNEKESVTGAERKSYKGHSLTVKIILWLLYLMSNCIWMIAIIIVFPFKRLRRQSLILLAVVTLFILLTSMTIFMLLRVNDLSRQLEAGSTGGYPSPFCKTHDVIGHFSQYLDQKRLERAKSILKTNLMTVSQIHEALVKLDENLQTS